MIIHQRRLVRVAAAAVAVIGWGAALVVALPSALAATVSFTFTKIADTSTPIPGGGVATFSGFNTPSIGGGDVVFLGLDGSFQPGIYSTVGGPLGTVADTSTAVPGGGGVGNFTGFGDPSIGGGDVAFRGEGGTSLPGIYRTAGGLLGAVADTSTFIPPGGVTTFTGFGPFSSIAGGEVVFSGINNFVPQNGVYSTVGALNAVADLNTAIPGPSASGNFTSFVVASFDGTDVAFVGNGTSPVQQGIYSTVGGSLGVVADLSTAIPDGTGDFTGLTTPSIDGGDVAFAGGGAAESGIYSTVGGLLGVVADTNTLVPGGGGGNFQTFGVGPSIDGGNVAFIGAEAGGGGFLVLSLAGMLNKVIGQFETLDGKTVNSFGMFTGGLSGNSIVFLVNFAADASTGFQLSSGIYRADFDPPVSAVPLPAALPLFLSALAGLGFFGWRRRQAGG